MAASHCGCRTISSLDLDRFGVIRALRSVTQTICTESQQIATVACPRITHATRIPQTAPHWQRTSRIVYRPRLAAVSATVSPIAESLACIVCRISSVTYTSLYFSMLHTPPHWYGSLSYLWNTPHSAASLSTVLDLALLSVSWLFRFKQYRWAVLCSSGKLLGQAPQPSLWFCGVCCIYMTVFLVSDSRLKEHTPQYPQALRVWLSLAVFHYGSPSANTILMCVLPGRWILGCRVQGEGDQGRGASQQR